MPRKPISRHQIVKPWPFTFSPFGRSVAQATAYKVKRQIQNSKFQRKSSIKSAGGNLAFDVSKDKKSESGSSDEGEFEVSTYS